MSNRSHTATILVVAAVLVLVFSTLWIRNFSGTITRNLVHQPAPDVAQVDQFASNEKLRGQSLLFVDGGADFAGIQFGTKIESLDGLEEFFEHSIAQRRTYLTREIVWYRRSGDPAQFNGVQVRTIFYGFLDNKFVEAVIVPANREAGLTLLSILERRYPGKRINHETWLWRGEHVGFDYSGFCNLESSMVSFLYVFPSDHVLQFP